VSVHQYYTDSSYKNFNYFIELNDTDVAAVDPLMAEQTLDWCESHKKVLTTIIISHEHGDHTNAMDELRQKTGTKIWAHESAEGILSHVDRKLVDGEEIEIYGGTMEVLFTPGHTPIHICLLIKNEKGEHKGFIAMDTVFNAGVGNCKNGGNPEVLFESIKRIKNYVQDGATLYPGHDYIETNLKFSIDREPGNIEAKELLTLVKQVGGTSVETDMGKEKEINVFLRLDSDEVIKNLNEETTCEKEVFLALRRLRDKW